MTTSKHNVTRRQTLAGIALAGASVAAPVGGATIGKAADRSAWNATVARLRAIEAEFSRFDGRLLAVHDAAQAICPRRDEFFSRYGMGCGWSRDRNFRAAHMSLVIERAKGRHLTPEEAVQTTADAYRVVDDFETWQARHNEAFAEYDAMQEQFDAIADERHKAREAVLAAEAPDHAALLFKIELLAEILEEADAEDAERLSAVREDARRLLGRA